ncbi:tetratricopeptide repeat protein [Planctomycetota bacterium]
MDKRSIFGLEPDQLDEILSVVTGDLDESELDKAESSSPDHAKHSKKSQFAGATASLQGSMEQPGGQIGRYKLLNVLGEGGMGIVYLAEQQRPIKRRVALKVIKPGMDSKRVIARFEAERQALALLDHPNIAHVHDAGTTEAGRPYFVMEYVKGLSITEHCDHHKLTIEDRLNLFRQVCLAVHHAHQKGIIHRDIKPSNILVSIQDDKATPKIIDFGVAKAIAQPLTERTLATEDSQLLGTPEYMSPEQADMASVDIDTRSDIYSLGVLLYVLLTGALPFDSDTLRTGGIERIRQIIRETDPKTPSTRLTGLGEEAKKVARSRRTDIGTLAKKLHKELEWIPLKAMRKERAERYRSASEFADDIENYLKSAALIAGPESTMYLIKKFVKRKRALVTGVAAVLAVLIVGIVVSMLFAFGQARARAEAQSIADFLRTGVLGTVTEAKVGEATVTYMLDAASKNLEGLFKDQPLVEASIRDTIGWTYRNLGKHDAAEPHLERALSIRQEHLGAEHLDTLSSVGHLAWLRCSQSRYTEAVELLEKAISSSRRVLGDEDTRMLSFANTLGCAYVDLGRYDEAEQLYLKGVPATRRVLGEKNGLSLFMVGNLGQTYERQGRYDEAERQFLETLRLREGVWDDENGMTLIYKGFLARVYRKQKRYEQAERLYLEILPIQRRVNGDEHYFTLWSVSELARVYTHLGKHDEAEELFAEALEGLQRMMGREHRDTIRCMNGLGELYTAQLKFDEAKTLLTETLEVSRRTLGEDHPWTLTSMYGLAIVYKEQGDYDKAEPLLLEAVEGRRLKLGDTHPHTLESRNNLIDLYEAWGKPEKAEEWRVKLPQTEAKRE